MTCVRRRCSVLYALAAAAALVCARPAPAADTSPEDAPPQEAELHDASEPIPSSKPDAPSFGSIFGDSTESDDESSHSAFTDPSAAHFGEWESLTAGGLYPDHDKPPLRPFDWMRKFGFHHSSTEGPYVDKNVPMERTSWLNRPYHIDWFSGPLLGSELNGNTVEQQSTVIGGLRLGWDFDYYWGAEWRFGWASPDLNSTLFANLEPGDYFASDVDLVYYPWGDTKVRPYLMSGIGVVQLNSYLLDGPEATPVPYQATLLSMPLGGGVQFPLTRWAAMRLDVVDNIAFGGDGVDTLNNFLFSAGMEFRLGARPNSYWPWRTSRNVW